MSGILFQLNTNGTTVNREIFNKMLSELEFRGEDGCNTEFPDCAAFGCHHFWTTPEDKGVIQPVKSPNNIFILYDGRIDNRDDLFSELGISNKDSTTISDEELILKAFHKWKEKSFAKFVGSFAFILYFKESKKVLAVRDQVGDRTLFYYKNNKRLIIASEPISIVAHPEIPKRMNERKIVEYFSGKDPIDNDCYFENVYEIYPSHYLLNDGEDLNTKKYWDFNLQENIRYKSDGEYSEHFLEIFEKSVKSKLRTINTPGIMMSGGLDSTSIAAVASNNIENKLNTYSYVFNKYSECDESSYIDEFCNIYDVESYRINGDKYIPIVDVNASSISPNFPNQDFYQLLKIKLYNKVRVSGSCTLLTGWYADELFTGSAYWLKDSIKDLELLRVYNNLSYIMKKEGWKNFHKNKAVRIVFRKFRYLKNMFKSPAAFDSNNYLTPYAKSMLDEKIFWDSELSNAERFEQVRYVLGINNAFDASASMQKDGGVNIDFRYPFRDLRLIDFLLKIPAYQIYENHEYKHKYILKNAMRNKLPSLIINRKVITTFTVLLENSFNIIKETVNLELNDNLDIISRYIEKNVLIDIINKEFGELDSREFILFWNIFTFVKWKEKVLNKI